jgi:hypothetical protein
MKIHISDKKKISSLQKEFSNAFPFLRLEFFSKPHYAFSGNSRQNMITDCKTIGDCRKIHNSSSISITPAMKVEELEKIFNDIFGLFVQVFRLSGRVWLETTLTDDWTLAEQNQQGEELSKYRSEKAKPFPAEDYSDVE